MKIESPEIYHLVIKLFENMEKRTYKSIVTPEKLSNGDINKCKKVKISSLDIENELDGLCFDDDEDEEMFSQLNIVSGQTMFDSKYPPESFKLDLATHKRCKVEDVQNLSNEKNLIVIDKSSGFRAKCSLNESWFDTPVDVGSIVSIKAIWDANAGTFIVDNKQGIIVTSSDTLVSGTTLVGSLFCTRKSMLAEKFRQIIGEESKIVSSSMELI